MAQQPPRTREELQRELEELLAAKGGGPASAPLAAPAGAGAGAGGGGPTPNGSAAALGALVLAAPPSSDGGAAAAAADGAAAAAADGPDGAQRRLSSEALLRRKAAAAAAAAAAASAGGGAGAGAANSARPSSEVMVPGKAASASGSFDSAAAKSWHQPKGASFAGPGAPGEGGGGGGGRAGRGCLGWLPLQAIGEALRRHPSIWMVPLLVFLALATGGVIGVVMAAANETAQRRQAAEGAAINAALAFERQLGQMFGPLLSLATIIRFNPDYKKVNASFDTIARELLDQMPTDGAVTTLLAAPQGVLRNFYPLKGYCQDHCDNININLFKNPERRAIALETVRYGRLTIQGPMNLSQGYFGVVGRQPIFIKNVANPNETWGAPDGPAWKCDACYDPATKTRFWGFVNAVINFETLVSGQDSRMRDLKELGYRYDMFMTKQTPKGPKKVEIAQSAQRPESPVSVPVHVPNGTWTLQISPHQGWVPSWRSPVLAAAILVSALIGLLSFAIAVGARLQTWLKDANDALAQEKERMDVLLARQYNLISCVLQAEGRGGSVTARNKSVEHTTLARIEDMRREIGVAPASASGFDELQLVELMDEGTYGKVFRGLWRGSVVAVKTMILPAKMSGAEKRERMAIMEAAISSAIQHPNIVQTYTYVIKPSAISTSVTPAPSTADAGANGNADSSAVVIRTADTLRNLDVPEGSDRVHNFEVSLVLEYCDWGSLRTALDEGAFWMDDGTLNYAALLDTAADVARAMMHLHNHNVLHSDLKARNVLLKSDVNSRGCVAKVADFGLAVRMDHTATHVSAFQGTMSHMAPEALLHGRISKPGDVYSFGIMLWELVTGGQPYQGIPRALVGHKVAVLGLRPPLPSNTPRELAAIMEACWAADAEKRPTFAEVLSRLVAMRHALHVATTPALKRYDFAAVQAHKRTSSELRHAHGAGAAANDGANGGGPDGAGGGGSSASGHRSYYVDDSGSTGFGHRLVPPRGAAGAMLGANQTLETIDDEAEAELDSGHGHGAAAAAAAVAAASAAPDGVQGADVAAPAGGGRAAPWRAAAPPPLPMPPAGGAGGGGGGAAGDVESQ